MRLAQVVFMVLSNAYYFSVKPRDVVKLATNPKDQLIHRWLNTGFRSFLQNYAKRFSLKSNLY